MMSEFPRLEGFEFHKLLGKGGMATVYLATQQSLHRDVAIKVMAYSNDQEFLQRFLNEGRLIASINHPNVITVYDVGQLEDGRSFIAMEYVEGGDLEHRLEQGPVPAREALQMIRQAAECMSVVHDKGIIHRDIKPANFLFRSDATLVVTDFGVAKNVDNVDVKLTQDGHTMGSPAYCSPEQAQCKAVDGRTDIYSLGVVLAEMLLGENPFHADTYLDTTLAHVSGDLPQLPADMAFIQPLLDRMLAKDPDDRFDSMQQLVDEIDDLLPLIDAGVKSVELPGNNIKPGSFPYKRLLSIAAVIGVLLSALLVYQSTRPFAAEFREARQLVKQGKLVGPAEPNAEAVYREVMAKDLGNKRAERGLLKLADELLEFAEKRVEESKVSQPPNDNALFYFRHAKRLGLPESEQQAFREEAIESLVDSALSAEKHGHYFEPEEQAAWSYYRVALKIDSENPDLKDALADFLEQLADHARQMFEQEQFEESLDVVKRGLKIDSRHPGLLAAQQELREKYRKLPRSKKKASHLRALDKLRGLLGGEE